MREQYLKMRNSGKLDINLFYRYFKEKGGKLNEQHFQFVFLMQEYMNMAVKHFDIGFQISFVRDKEGNIIKIY